jgi:hypothetical protein
MTDKDWGLSTVCVSTAPGPATLTNVWPVSWVSANLDFDTYSFWPPTLPSGIILPTTVITKPTVIAEAIPIMWESTDTLVQSWFDRVQGSVPTHLTTSPPPTQSATTPTSTNTKTSGALNRGRGNNLSVAALGALSLITLLILSS